MTNTKKKMKVYGKYTGSNTLFHNTCWYLPQIKICNETLSEYGFRVGDELQVNYSVNHLLIVRKENTNADR